MALVCSQLVCKQEEAAWANQGQISQIFTQMVENLSFSLQDLKPTMVVYFSFLIRKLRCLFVINIIITIFPHFTLFLLKPNLSPALDLLSDESERLSNLTLVQSIASRNLSQNPAKHFQNIDASFWILMHLWNVWVFPLIFCCTQAQSICDDLFFLCSFKSFSRKLSLWRDHKKVHFKCISGEDVKTAFGGDAAGEGGD